MAWRIPKWARLRPTCLRAALARRQRHPRRRHPQRCHNHRRRRLLPSHHRRHLVAYLVVGTQAPRRSLRRQTAAAARIVAVEAGRIVVEAGRIVVAAHVVREKGEKEKDKAAP